MAVSLFEWRALTEAIKKIIAPQKFVLSTVFKTVKNHMANTLDVEIIVGNKKLAPFVSPIEGGVVVEKLGRHVDTVKFPRIRMKKPLNAKELTDDKFAGDVYVSGGGDIQSYRQQKIAEELLELKTRGDRRLEWMACMALTGGYEVSQDNIAFKLDFGMPAANKPVLTGTALWSDAASKPIKNLRAWKKIIQNATGLTPNIVILGSDAADAFLENADVQKKLDNRNYNVGTIKLEGSNYLGHIAGLDIYEYNEQYTADDGSTKDMIDAKACIMLATSARFELHYGAIYDLKCGTIVSEWFAKQYEEEDPSALWLLAETDPLPVPHQPEAIVYATVL